jgi:hypothetical protein
MNQGTFAQRRIAIALARCVKSPEDHGQVRLRIGHRAPKRLDQRRIDASEMQIRRWTASSRHQEPVRAAAPHLEIERRLEDTHFPVDAGLDAAVTEGRGDPFGADISKRSYSSSLPTSARNGSDSTPIRPVDGAT